MESNNSLNHQKTMSKESWGNTTVCRFLRGIQFQEDTLTPYLFIPCLHYVLWTPIDLIKENGFTLKEARSRWYPAKTMRDTDYIDDLALLTNTPAQAESLLHSLEQSAGGISFYVNANKTKFKQEASISTLSGKPKN